MIKYYLLAVLFLYSFALTQNLKHYAVEVDSVFIRKYEQKKLDNPETYTWNPLHVGNHWQYTDWLGYTIDKKIVEDTTINDQRYFKTSQFGKNYPTIYERNDSNSVYLYDLENYDNDTTTNELLCDSLNLPVNNSFKTYRYYSGYSPNQPDSVYIYKKYFAYIPLFDDTVQVIWMEYWEGPLYETYWLYTYDAWAEKYGLIESVPEANHGFLTGAIINGKQYGTILSIETKTTNTPENYLLLQNYPNPFNPSTVIEYAIPAPCYVQLNIFNVIGQKIKTLVSENKSPGTYKISWNGGEYPSGIYPYILRTKFGTKFSKMIILK
ncbi:MAG: T9SS type A sorting domain-containing protein [Calditrichaceae bacterium]|nr:T9SS type A sorting domain-containing protein [Calditrichaceae bacterium]MBN2707696.1 T9SS type A sorting domain-containing protein [Calditrichaceae bacterium]RQV96490.1 MAG: T9SS C-terminal target domain-containing protein [Calditrichota bacterium]